MIFLTLRFSWRYFIEKDLLLKKLRWFIFGFLELWFFLWFFVFLRTFSRMVSNEIAMEYITSSPLTNTFLNEIFFYKMYRKGLLYIHSSHLTFFSCVSSILASRFMIYIYTEEKFIQRQWFYSWSCLQY